MALLYLVYRRADFAFIWSQNAVVQTDFISKRVKAEIVVSFYSNDVSKFRRHIFVCLLSSKEEYNNHKVK